MTNQEEYVNQLHQQFIDYGFELRHKNASKRVYRLDIESKEHVYVSITLDCFDSQTYVTGNVYDYGRTLLNLFYTNPEFDRITENIERVLKNRK